MYLNVMNRLSVDCDCLPNPSEPDMHDIGVLSSLDPVALDQACVDLIHIAPDGASPNALPHATASTRSNTPKSSASVHARTG